MKGWIKINRAIAEHWIYQDAERLKWWLDLLFLASPTDRRIVCGACAFTLGRGQIMTSAVSLSHRWGKDRRTVSKFLKLLEDEKMIEKKVMYTRMSIVTICDYESYKANVHRNVHSDVHPINSEYNIINNLISNNPITSNSLIIDNLINNIFPEGVTHACEAREEKKNYIEELILDANWLDLVMMRYKIAGADEVLKQLNDFQVDLDCSGVEHKDIQGYKRHFANWLKIQFRESKNEQFREPKKQDKRRSTDVTATSEEDYSTEF